MQYNNQNKNSTMGLMQINMTKILLINASNLAGKPATPKKSCLVWDFKPSKILSKIQEGIQKFTDMGKQISKISKC